MADKLTREQKEGQHELQHAFHSGWTATSEDARGNADVLRGHMADLGMDTDPKNWAVFSDPREWQVLKEKEIIGGEDPPSMLAAADLMARNTMSYRPTMWHGHSQGAAQITSAGDLAAERLALDAKIQRKAKKSLEEEREEGDDSEISKKAIAGRALEKAQGRLNKYNMFSYSGGASYPPEWAENATFSHKRGDPVSSTAVKLGKGPDWEADGDGREDRTLHPEKKGLLSRKYLQLNIGNHGYNENYAENDAEVTEKMLRRTQRFQAGQVLDVAPLTEEVEGERTGDDYSLGPLLRRAPMAIPSAIGSVAAEGYEMAKDSAVGGVDLMKSLGKGGWGLAKGGYGLARSGLGKAKGLFSHYED